MNVDIEHYGLVIEHPPKAVQGTWRRWLYLYGQWLAVAALTVACGIFVYLDGRGLGYW